MICDKCGAQASDDDAFCPKCGQPTGTANAELGETPLVPKTRKSGLIWGIVAAAVFVAVIGGGAFYWTQSKANIKDAKAAATKAIEAVGKVNVAVAIGVNQGDYSTRLLDAAAAVETYAPKDATGKAVRRSLVKSVLYYSAAGEAWNEKVSGSTGLVLSGKYRSQYPELQFKDGSIALTAAADDVIQSGWAVAGEAYDQAKTEMAAYGK